MALLCERLYFEEGMLSLIVGPHGSFETRHPPGSYDHEALEWHRKATKPGRPFVISMGVQPAPGVPAPPEAMQAILESPVDHAYCAEFGSLLTSSKLIDQGWVGTLLLKEQGLAELEERHEALKRAAGRTTFEASGLLERQAVDHVAHDLAFSATVGRPVAMDEIHAPLLRALARANDSNVTAANHGNAALALWAPNFSDLSWPDVIALHDHDAIGAFREKLREAEAAVAGVQDEHEREGALRDIGMREAIEGLRRFLPSYRDLAADVVVDTALGGIPYAGTAFAAARGVARVQEVRSDWTAVLLRIRDQVR